MNAVIGRVALVLGQTMVGMAANWATKLASEEFLRWAFFRAAECLVKSTATTEDDEWLAKVREVTK